MAKKGILTALMESNKVIPQVVIQFDDAKTGEKAKLAVDHNRPELRAEAAALSITDTMDNNRIGKLSDWVPVLWDRVAQNDAETIKAMTDDERITALAEILRCDAQVNLSIDFAKKKPDVEELRKEGLEWVDAKQNKLESEKHKHAGKIDAFTTEMTGITTFYPEIPTKEGELKGTNSILVKMHNVLKEIPETVGMKVVGRTTDGHCLFEVTEHAHLDKSRYKTAFWGNEGLPCVKREEVCRRLNILKTKADERGADKLDNLIKKITSKNVLTNPNVENSDWLEIAEKVYEVFMNTYTVDQIYEAVGQLAKDELHNAEQCWKAMSDIALANYVKKADCFVQKEDKCLSDSVRTLKLNVELFIKSWAEAKAYNEHTEEVNVSNEMTAEEAEAIAEEYGF